MVIAVKIPQEDAALWTNEERDAWRRPADVTVSQWADTNRILDPKTSAEPGQWRTSRTPYLREIMDSFSDRHVETITIMSSTQVGKTEALYNMLGYSIDQDPGPALLVMPDEPSAKSISKNRVLPMIQDSPSLSRHYPRNEDDIAKLEYNLKNMIVYFAGAQSPGKLSSKPIKYLFRDETDKYPLFSGREASPLKLSEERTRTYWNRKIVNASTPTNKKGYVWLEYQQSDKRRYFVPCPLCGHYQVLVWSNVRFPENERDAEKIKECNLAWYECEKCKGKIFDKNKPEMVARGLWVPEGAYIENGKVKNIKVSSHRGYWLNCLYSPWLTFGEVVAEFLDSKDDAAKMMNFTNSWLAETWEEKVQETSEYDIKACRIKYELGTVPDGVIVLTAAADVQKDYFKCVIRGWGYKEESWLISAFRAESWEDIEEAFLKTVYGPKKLIVRLACIDSRYRTDEVYDFCRKYRHICRAIKGVEHLKNLYQTTIIDKNLAGKRIKGGLTYWTIDTGYYKDKLTRFIYSEPGDTGEWHIPDDVHGEYLKEMVSEHKVMVLDKRTKHIHMEWRQKSQHLKNDYWDAEVYNIFAADIIKVYRLRKDAGEVRHQRTEAVAKPEGGFVRTSSAWLGNTNGWIRGR